MARPAGCPFWSSRRALPLRGGGGGGGGCCCCCCCRAARPAAPESGADDLGLLAQAGQRDARLADEQRASEDQPADADQPDTQGQPANHERNDRPVLAQDRAHERDQRRGRERTDRGVEAREGPYDELRPAFGTAQLTEPQFGLLGVPLTV